MHQVIGRARAVCFSFGSRIHRSEAGSFTLESAIMYPMLLAIIISIVFFSLYVYEKAELYQSASSVAERASYTWDNSGKDWLTGNVLPGQYDGLYWRTFGDGLSGILAFGTNLGKRVIDVQAAREGSSSSNTADLKLNRAAQQLPANVRGEVTYRHGLIEREVAVQVKRTGLLPFLSGLWTDSQMEAELRSYVTEPVELIRSVDFVRGYIGRVKQLLAKPGTAVTEPAQEPEEQLKLSFARAEEAAEYIRKLTGGVKVTLETPSGTRRQLDALDADGLMHEVKLGYTAKSEAIQSQVDKDLAMMQQGQTVKGVVWHFFRKEKDGKIGPSKPLRQYLEKRGIIVVIHN